MQRELEAARAQQASTPASQTGPFLPQDESMTDEPDDPPSAQQEHGSLNDAGTSYLTAGAGALQFHARNTQSKSFQPTSTPPQQAQPDTFNGGLMQPGSGDPTNPFSFASPQANTNPFASIQSSPSQNNTLDDTLARMQDRSRRFDGVGTANSQAVVPAPQPTQDVAAGVISKQRSNSGNNDLTPINSVQSSTWKNSNASSQATRFSRPGKPKKSQLGRPAR